MFEIIDHVTGAIFVRIQRITLNLKNKADLSYVDSYLFLGGHCKIQRLAYYGIGTILDMREETMDNQNDLKKFGIRYLQIKVTNINTPNISDIRLGVDWIIMNIRDGKKVFVHCNLGRGRGPLMMCSYLINNGMTVNSTIKKIKNAIKYTYFNKKQLKWISKLEQNL